MATHSSIPARKITWTEEPGSYSPGSYNIGNISYDKRRQHIKKQRHHFAEKGSYSQSYGSSSSRVWM